MYSVPVAPVPSLQQSMPYEQVGTVWSMWSGDKSDRKRKSTTVAQGNEAHGQWTEGERRKHGAKCTKGNERVQRCKDLLETSAGEGKVGSYV